MLLYKSLFHFLFLSGPIGDCEAENQNVTRELFTFLSLLKLRQVKSIKLHLNFM